MIVLWFSVLIGLLNVNGVIRATEGAHQEPTGHFETSFAYRKNGPAEPEGSYFGFSVAGHVEIVKPGAVQKPWLLVGSPLGKNLQLGTTRSGALFKCPISDDASDCEQVSTDTGVANITSEEKENQWLGVTVRSGGVGGKAIVCAHRYVEKYSVSYLGVGLCYLFPNNLNRSDAWTLRLCSEYDCQSGLSAAILDENNVLIGSPYYEKKETNRRQIEAGAVYKYDLNARQNESSISLTNFNSSQIRVNFGMAIAYGHYFNKASMAFAVGAPRMSTVYVFKSINDEDPKLLSNNEVGSNFGYELISADVNGDLWPDLIVGAPMFFAGQHIGGAVYVYHNHRAKNKNIPFHNKKHYPLLVPLTTEAAFGLAMANLGDINNDGCEDIAIGAPYEGNGVVYIFLGKSTVGMEKAKPSQVLRPSDFPNYSQPKPMETFGYSLSGGIDFDQNSYPDLLIGSMQSDSVIAVLTRPMFNLSIYIDPKTINLIQQWTTESISFQLDVLCGLIKHPLHSTLDTEYPFDYQIETVKSPGQSCSVSIDSSPNKPTSNTKITSKILLSTNGADNPQKHVVYVSKNQLTDELYSIKFRVSLKYKHKNMTVNPLVEPNTMVHDFEATFDSKCKDWDLENCATNLFVKSAALLNMDKEDEMYRLVLDGSQRLELQITVANTKNSASNAKLYVEHESNIKFTVASGISGCKTASDRVVVCDLENPFVENSIADITMTFNLDSLRPSQYTFTVFTKTTSRELMVRRNTTVSMRVDSNSALLTTGRSEPEQVDLNEFPTATADHKVRFLDDIGPLVHHVYTVRNNGSIPVYDLVLVIEWPFRTVDHKLLLYLLDVPRILIGDNDEDAYCESNPAVNPKQLKYRAPSRDGDLQHESTADEVGGRRFARRSVPDDIFTISPKNKELIETVNITCHIGQLQRQQEANITIISRYWNQTKIESPTRIFRIASKFHITSLDGPNAFNESTSRQAETTMVPKLDPFWMITLTWILVTVVFGLLFLALITWYLTRIGFFKRNRVDKTLYRETKVKADAVRASMRYTLQKNRCGGPLDDDVYLMEQLEMEYGRMLNQADADSIGPEEDSKCEI